MWDDDDSDYDVVNNENDDDVMITFQKDIKFAKQSFYAITTVMSGFCNAVQKSQQERDLLAWYHISACLLLVKKLY